MDIADDLRDEVRGIIGRVHDTAILDACIQCFALDGTVLDREQDYATRAEIIMGARIASAYTYLATQTFEGRPLTTGIIVCTPPKCLQILEMDPEGKVSGEFFIGFAEPVTVDWNDNEQVAKFAQLADGHKSILLGDTQGRIHGVLDIEGYDVRAYSWGKGGFALVTSKNRELALYFSWRFAYSAAAIYNGYKWGYGVPTAMETIRSWHAEELVKAGQYEWGRMHNLDKTVTLAPILTHTGKIDSLIAIIEKLSTIRLSAIITICSHSAYQDLVKAGALRSLRPELDNATWEESEELRESYLPVFRLDGAHIISSPDLAVLGIAQQIALPNDSGIVQQGAGRTAAIYLSKLLGDAGIVIKVSSDGPVTVYQRGEVLKEVERTQVAQVAPPDSI